MRTILIVDDEIPSRELIKMSLDWQGLGYAILEARNGREALEIYRARRPYLVITDVQMPVMDGLELIRAIRREDAGARIAILSCHESFTYAKEALKLGVMDYLIKDQMTGDTLVNLLSAAERWRPQPFKASGGALREALGRAEPSPEALEALGGALGDEKDYIVCAVRREEPAAPDWGERVERRLGVAMPGVQASAAADGLYILCPLDRSVSATRRLRSRADAVGTAREALDAFSGAPVTLGVSRVKQKPESLGEAVREARHAMNAYVFLGKGRSLYFEDAYRQADARQLQVLDESIGAIKKALGERDGDLLIALVARLYQKELCGMLQYNYLRHINAVLLGMLTRACDENGLPYGRVFPSDILSFDALEAMDSVEEISAWYQARFRALCDALSVNYGSRLTGVMRYIEQHFQKDISLEALARAFGMNKAYLAKVFKANTGMSVNEYIRELRLERAKALLDQPDARVGEVGEALGFHNPQTFYNLFKRYAGQSPSEYKEMCDVKRAHRTLNREEEET